ncbi:MAG: UDP-glucose 4-epimerase [Chlamydiales bacterium]|nr:UDP-glucose 4-epimerase [Chlamydiales bacterium]MCH9635074.1 UDP-glucose 4-epimerase [Chlamydiales bacterium]
MKKILVTGAAGYIGSVLTPMLLDREYQVVALDNLMYRQISLIDCFGKEGFRFVKGDCFNEALMQELLGEVDAILPLAAVVGAPACKQNPKYAHMVNVEAIRLILRYIKPEQQIVFPNTNSGYGIGQEGIFCDEKTPLRPVSDYGKWKVQIEEELLQTKQAVSLRLATVFGVSPRMRTDLLVNDFTYRACHDRTIVVFEENFKRNYIHVRDVANAFIFALEHFEQMKGEAFNVGLSEANLSKKELCDTIRKYIPNLYYHAAPIGKDPDQRDYIVSNEKLEGLGWMPTKSLESGIQELIDAFSIIKNNQFANV